MKKDFSFLAAAFRAMSDADFAEMMATLQEGRKGANAGQTVKPKVLPDGDTAKCTLCSTEMGVTDGRFYDMTEGDKSLGERRLSVCPGCGAKLEAPDKPFMQTVIGG